MDPLCVYPACDLLSEATAVQHDCSTGPIEAWGHFPVSHEQWQAVLQDACLPKLCDRFRGEVTTAAASGGPAGAQAAYVELRRACRHILWFHPPVDTVPSQASLIALADAIAEVWQALQSSPVCPHPSADRAMRKAVTGVQCQVDEISASTAPGLVYRDARPVVEQVFGMPPTRQWHGSAGALRAAVKGRETEIESLALHLYGHLMPSKYDYVPDPTRALAPLLRAPRPLMAHRTAVLVCDAILRAAPTRSEQCAAVYAPLTSGADTNGSHTWGLCWG
jgi:hypothetical protein